MGKEIYISSTPHETRLAIVEDEALTEIYYERENEYTLAGSIYNGRVTRVLPGMQSSFVDVGLERDAFLYITDFLEEAPDSDEFDTASTGDRGPRTIQGERGEGGAPRGEAGAQNGGQNGGQNGERGGRGRRGARDRDRNADRGAGSQGTADRPADRPSDRNDAPRISADPTDSASLPPSSSESSEIGEGAPGADGNRRWRGRRGRRRGRGTTPGQPAEAGQENSASAYPEESAYPAEHSGADSDSYRDIDAADAGTSAAPVDAQQDRAGRSGERGRRGRGGRRGEGQRSEARPEQGNGQGNGQSPERGLDQSPQQSRQQGQEQDQERGQERGPEQGQRFETRSSRGSAPSRDSYGAGSGTGPVANAYPDEDSGSADEPLILPGESLSKYRKGDDAATDSPAQSASQATPMTLAPPANLYTLAEGWDGGSVLPGETIRPRTGGANRESAGSQGRFEREPRRDGRGGRDHRGGSHGRSDNGGRDSSQGRDQRGEGRRESRGESTHDNRAGSGAMAGPDAVQPASEPRAQATFVPEVAGGFVPEMRSGQVELSRETHASQTLVESTGVEPIAAGETASADAINTASELTAQLVPVEYEPSEASASYRVDPVAPSEFRQSAAVLDAPVLVEAQAQATEETIEPSTAHSITPVPGEPVAKLHSETDGAAEGEAAATGMHDVTSISAGGEMLSEPVAAVQAPASVHEPAPIETAEPTSPIRYEGAVVLPDAVEMEAAAERDFAQGRGKFEEETLDDEPYGATLQASSIEEIDDLEEEALDGAADLGTMLREMSIDHITRTAPQGDEDDDADQDELNEEDLDEEDLDEEDLDEEELDEDELDEAEAGQENNTGTPRGDRAPGQSDYNSSEVAARSGSAGDAVYFEQQFGQSGEQNRGREQAAGDGGQAAGREPGREPGRDSERRGGRRDRDGRRGRTDRDRGADRSPDRGSDRGPDQGGNRNSERGRGGRSSHSNGHGRHSMQTTDLPAISDLLKPGQEILVQIAKEPIAKKGARITSHIALPGRFLVFMPTVNHTGVSRKIESDGERRRLKDILLSEKGDATGGFIVRTAAEGASEEELRSDLRFLLNLWADIKNRSESSKSPALIYHDLNLIERILRDQVTDNFSAIWVDTEAEYERVLRFLQRFQPSLIRRVKLYLKDTPLFEQFGITEEINKALRSKVWLKSGGSIVINQTEALVAIDINTGKFVGKTARLEDTIVKTNLDAIPEIVRQIRLRDLGGIIIIDFIDMDERKNRNRVMAALEDELKSDRAPSKVLPFNDFGLIAITRKRVKQSLERTLSTPCAICTGTGMVKSPVTVCNDIYIEMRKMHKALDRGDVMLRVHPEVVKQLKTSGAKWLQEMEEMVGKTILVKSDPSLHPEQFDIH